MNKNLKCEEKLYLFNRKDAKLYNVQTKKGAKIIQRIYPPPKTPQILCVLLFALTLHFLLLLGGSSVFLHSAQRMKAVDLCQNVLKKYSLKHLYDIFKATNLAKVQLQSVGFIQGFILRCGRHLWDKFLSNMREEKSKRLTLKLPLARVFSR